MLRMLRSFALGLVLLSLAAPAAAQPKKKVAAKEEKAEAGKEDPGMAAMMKLATPGAPHKALKLMEGTFSVSATFWMVPGKPPVKSTGTAENKMVLGDRFLQQEFSGAMMGKPYSGLGLTGYDNQKKKVVATWCDSMGTMLLVFEGTADKAWKAITTTTEFVDPATGKTKKAKAVTRIASAKKHTYEWFETEDGKTRKTMEIVYTRK